MTTASLSSFAEEAAAGFDRLCSILGGGSLSSKQLAGLLSGSNCSENGQQLLDDLISMCREAEAIASRNSHAVRWTKSKALENNHLDGDALRNLYTFHPSYTTCKDPVDTAGALTTYVKHIFDTAIDETASLDFEESSSSLSNGSLGSTSRTSETSGSTSRRSSRRSSASSVLSRRSASNLLKNLANDEEEEKKMDGPILEREIEIAVENLMIDHGNIGEEEQELDLEMVASSLLRYRKPKETANGLSSINPKTLFDGRLAQKIFDPFHTSSNAFVTALDSACRNHDALNHHLLTSLSMGLFDGIDGTIHRLADFMQAYRHFTSFFCTYLAATMKMVGEMDPTGHHLEILQENMEEEQGIYDDETIGMIESLGLDADVLRNVPHKELYTICYEGLRQRSQVGHEGLTEEQCSYIAEPLVSAFDSACDPTMGATAATAISAMYLGSELIVASMYSKLSNYLVSIAGNDPNCPVTKQDLAFFLLHIDMDVDHAEKMRQIVVSLASDESTRLQIASAADTIMSARLEFCDRFVEASFPPTGHGGEDSAKLYNKQSQNWVRKGATCLSDFTGRPVVFEACSPFVEGAHVLDVGCGEGYGARKLVEMGAKRIIGFDISGEMIERAKTNPNKSTREFYETCDADKIVQKLEEMPATLGLVPGRILEEGCFDLAIAIFLFNYTSIDKMKKICKQIYQTLKPGGHFIFSVPHPFMLNAHGSDKDQGDTFSFAKGNVTSDSYFSLRDRKFSGVIRTLDGRSLNVKMLFKSISDYIETMGTVGFDISDIHECRVLPEHVAAHPEFFASVSDSPLHMVFDVVKPRACAAMGRIPKALPWSPIEKAHSDRILTVAMPETVLAELVDFSISACDRGETEDTFAPTVEDVQRLSHVSDFAAMLRARIQTESGAVYIQGLDLDRLGANTNPAGRVGRAKFAYYILSSLIGKVDGSARGRLFDVRDRGLDTKADNVLFSVSQTSAPYHTDGASADRAYDAVGLLCIEPAAEGGRFYLSNAASALASLKTKLPKFVLNELFRPLPRDILENGKGQGVQRGDLVRFARSPELRKLRVRHNAYPIFEEGLGSNADSNDELLRFRYMRQWIESGHSKARLCLSPLLRFALDALDAALEEEKVASIRMQPGDMVFCNNMSFAHSRDAFANKAGDPGRHKVRVWLKLYETNEETEPATATAAPVVSSTKEAATRSPESRNKMLVG